MPIEIKELFIKINVNDSDQSNASPNKEVGGNESSLIEACLELVQYVQTRKNDR